MNGKIVIICPIEELVSSWKEAFAEKAPHLSIEVYPNDTEREKTEFVLVFRAPEDAFKKYPNLKVIASMSAGINHITDEHQVPKDVIITKANDPMHKGDISKFVLALALSYMRLLPTYLQQKRKEIWEAHTYLRPEETTVGILGIGSIGRKVGELMLKNNFTVTGWSRSKKLIDGIQTFHGNSGKNKFLKTADILVCTLPLTEETKGILNKDLFEQLPAGAYIINIGRGEHLVEADLLAAIKNGTISGAALDVFQEEPLPKDHPFWNNGKITITPHTAGNVHPESAVHKILQNYQAMQKGEDLIDVVDLDRGY